MWVSTSARRPFFLSFLLCLIVSLLSFILQPFQPFQSIAHRGASFYAPENTMAAFQKAVDLGFDFIEFDVQLSKDSQLVVIHDADVQRTTDGVGYIRNLTIKEIKLLDAGSWFSPEFSNERIPLLEEVLQQFGGKIGLLIEMKSSKNQPQLTKLLSDTLMKYVDNGLKPSTLKVQSFNINEIKKFHELSPTVSSGILLEKPLNILHFETYSQYASFLSVNHQLLSKSIIHQAKQYGFDIYSWTIKKQYQFLMMQRLGVNAIISDEECKESNSRLLTLIFQL
ncbi:glycerophosphodiester phosphodiesterase [Cytobacillus massiliigabonensis]|uniref:glycerophosphodiester phosphodiesterase n=1 Tax=Cytobacillus massiliigabonensis TaxID=1871011 RepID=UPI001F288E2D|nr:glycerophosphodiester phosphodiesterase family protein [Cytobacillus massiliigabonensis]